MRLQRLFATESEKLGREIGGASGRFANLGDVIGHDTFCAGLSQDEIAVTENGGEKIIEVVRSSAGQLTEGFHFLGSTKLIVKLFPCRDVHQRSDHANGVAFRIATND